MLEVGETVERYQVEAAIGDGGLAVVFRVRHLQLGTLHALKVLTLTTATDRARLLAEGKVQARLRHPNVVAVTDLVSVNRTPALVMELVEGPTLEQWLRQGPLEPLAALALFRGIVSGVGAAHAAGVVHRDLKPANVLLSQSGSGPMVAKVTDFGLVRVLDAEPGPTIVGTAIGTPAYMAPEQIRDPSAVDGRADLWALGCLLYEMFTGRKAFPQRDPFALYTAIAAGEFEDPAVGAPDAPPAALEAIRGLLRTERDARIGSCVALWEQLWDDPAPPELVAGIPLDLREIVSITSTLRLRPTPNPGGLPAVRPPRAIGLVATAIAVGIALLVGYWTALWIGNPVDPPRRPEPPPAPIEPAPEPAPIEPAPAPAPIEVAPIPVLRTPRPAPPTTGEVAVDGDADQVWLEADGKRVDPGSSVPAGTYEVLVVWAPGAEARRGGELLVSPGGVVHLRCAKFVYACKVIDGDRP